MGESSPVKGLAILGSTGSIGRSALDVVDAHPDRLRVVSMAAGDNAQLFAEQVARYTPRAVAMATAGARDRLVASGPNSVARVGVGTEGLVDVATHPDVDLVICASSGTAGLEAVLAAIQAGKAVAIANKEVLVMAGALVTAAARRHGVSLLPIDSEHNAIHQCLHGRTAPEIKRLVLTASGGPFRRASLEELTRVTPEQALQHPTWQMGRKITIDSATLMNKGLEVIEAHWLFGVDAGRIDVLIHPQSVVHSMVELIDGSVIAQLGVTDMRLPIQYACSYPERWDGPLPALDLTRMARFDFEPPSLDRFPCLRLAFQALEAGRSVPAVLNAANEVAVSAFLERQLPFLGIPELVRRTLEAHTPVEVDSLETARAVDRWARQHAADVIPDLAGASSR